jgi:hypothetical protein
MLARDIGSRWFDVRKWRYAPSSRSYIYLPPDAANARAFA